MQEGILDHASCQAMIVDGAKGTVQVANYFGTSHLYTDLENARQRIVNLISLYLEHKYDGNLLTAAQSLRDNTFLSHSRGGNEMLKALHARPDCTVFGDIKGQSLQAFQDERTLAKPFSLSAYRKECQAREQAAATMDAALWLAKGMEVAPAALDFIAAEAVIRTALLVRAGSGESCPNRIEFAKLMDAIRGKTCASGKLRMPKAILEDVPVQYQAIAARILREIDKHDAPLIANPELALDALLNAVESRYFLRETGLEDVGDFDALVSKEWHKVTKGKEDPYSRLTVFMCIATGATPKSTVSETEARAMIRQVRQHGFDSDAVAAFIKQSAPFEIKENLLSLWQDEFLPEAMDYLLDDSDAKYSGAMKFLKENCNIKAK
ncbi:hypothetical protein [Paraherbaspirillum soli]|uniref:Uncharacterized protein n=1 Tax=Paraherbaspirillum soli TaxID=631222 RepID=A0ABW0MEY8_9BURK